MNLQNVVWTSVISVVLAIAGLVSALNNSDLTLTLGFSSIAFAILALRE